MPPQVFLDLGQAFLADRRVLSAERTFAQLARNLADERPMKVKSRRYFFEKSGKRSEALVRYSRLLREAVRHSDVALMARVAKLNDKRDVTMSLSFYQRGLNLLFCTNTADDSRRHIEKHHGMVVRTQSRCLSKPMPIDVACW